MEMNLRQRILTTLRGGCSDRIPWNIYAWLLPRNTVGQKMHAKGLSLMDSKRIYRPVLTDVSYTEERYTIDGEVRFHCCIDTPLGSVTEEASLDPTYGSRWIHKYFITRFEDYPIVEYFLRHTSFEPEFEPWLQADREVGEGGFVVGEVMPIPLMTLIVTWVGITGFAEALYDYPEQFESMLDALNVHYDRQVQLAAASPAEVIWFGDNVTGTIISPTIFERYCMPVYARVLPVLRAAGKFPIAHYDGSNRPLVKHLAKTELPVIEAFTPPPMGNLTVAEAKAAWREKVIWVNFPGNLFHESADGIYSYTMKLLEEGAPGGRLVIGCTEEYPLDQFEKTFNAIGKAMADYEGYPW
jgi:hypothetical protein